MDNLVQFWLFCFYFHLLFFIIALPPDATHLSPPYSDETGGFVWGLRQLVASVKVMIDKGDEFYIQYLINYCSHLLLQI